MWYLSFLMYLAQGYTVRGAYEDALDDIDNEFGETYGIENEVIVGNENQVVKH